MLSGYDEHCGIEKMKAHADDRCDALQFAIALADLEWRSC
jgi:hypothetical protein